LIKTRYANIAERYEKNENVRLAWPVNFLNVDLLLFEKFASEKAAGCIVSSAGIDSQSRSTTKCT
jgi:hypothetical protein